MTMSARIVNTSNWEHEAITVKSLHGGYVTLKPGEMAHVSVDRGPVGGEGKITTVELWSEIDEEPKPFTPETRPEVLAYLTERPCKEPA